MNYSRVWLDCRTIDDHFPGIGRYTFNLANALASAAPSWQFGLILNPEQQTRTRFDLSTLAAHANATVHVVPERIFSWQEQLSLLRRVPTAELIHFPYYIFPYAVRRPCIVTIFDIISHIFPAYLPSLGHRVVFELTTRLALQRAGGVLTLSNSAATDLQRVYGVPPTRLHITPAGIDKNFHPAAPADVSELRQRLGLPARYVLCVASNKPHKNLSRLIQAWGQLKTRAGNAKLVLAGKEDPRYVGIRTEIGKAGLQNDVLVLGNVTERDLPTLYSGAVAFIFPSLYEGFGLPVLEAMACGAAIACSNASSLPEVVDENSALLFNPTNADEMAGVLARLLNEPALCEQLGKHALLRAAEFTWQRTAEKTLAAYENVLRNSSLSN